MADSSKRDAVKVRQVQCDTELERGFFTSSRYYIHTPRFDYLGMLVAVTGTVYVVEDVYIVFESGPFDALRDGKPKDAQFLCKRGVLDRAGSHLFEMP